MTFCVQISELELRSRAPIHSLSQNKEHPALFTLALPQLLVTPEPPQSLATTDIFFCRNFGVSKNVLQRRKIITGASRLAASLHVPLTGVGPIVSLIYFSQQVNKDVTEKTRQPPLTKGCYNLDAMF